ncbi:N-6 DNA methylase [Komagataeibacter rhaeticus]|nr:N-6 DNA methylase [Komagataeibacter rhaeticus]
MWFLARNKNPKGWRDRRGEMLFIDARKLGIMVDRTRRELTDADVALIAGTYHAWRGEKGPGLMGTFRASANPLHWKMWNATALS